MPNIDAPKQWLTLLAVCTRATHVVRTRRCFCATPGQAAGPERRGHRSGSDAFPASGQEQPPALSCALAFGHFACSPCEPGSPFLHMPSPTSSLSHSADPRTSPDVLLERRMQWRLFWFSAALGILTGVFYGSWFLVFGPAPLAWAPASVVLVTLFFSPGMAHEPCCLGHCGAGAQPGGDPHGRDVASRWARGAHDLVAGDPALRVDAGRLRACRTGAGRGADDLGGPHAGCDRLVRLAQSRPPEQGAAPAVRRFHRRCPGGVQRLRGLFAQAAPRPARRARACNAGARSLARRSALGLEGEGPLPCAHEPRDPHADQRHPGWHRTAALHGPGCPPAADRRPATPEPGQPDRAAQRCARLRPARGWPPGDGAGRPARHRLRRAGAACGERA